MGMSSRIQPPYPSRFTSGVPTLLMICPTVNDAAIRLISCYSGHTCCVRIVLVDTLCFLGRYPSSQAVRDAFSPFWSTAAVSAISVYAVSG